MARIARQRAAQHVEMLAGRRHAAAAGLRKGRHAVHVGERGQAFGREVRGNARDHRGRAVHRRQDADEVARADAAAGALEAHEARALRLGHKVHRAQVLAEGRVAVAVHQGDVVAVHIVTGLQVARSHADHRVVLQHFLAGGDGARGDLVAGGNLRPGAHAEFGDCFAQGNDGLGNQNVVVRVQAKQGAVVHDKVGKRQGKGQGR
ncbi:hypothetical protein D3C80_1439500 [compost metagenome]